jgi:hypothetical protein
VTLSLISVNINYIGNMSAFITFHVSRYNRVFLVRKLYTAAQVPMILRAAISTFSSDKILMFKCICFRQWLIFFAGAGIVHVHAHVFGPRKFQTRIFHS